MRGCKRENVALMMRRRSGNMGSAPTNESPFYKAERFVKARREARIQEAAAGGARLHDDELAAAIARAWIALPDEARAKGWPGWAMPV